MDLNHHTLLARVPVPNFRDTVSRATNLQKDLFVDALLRRRNCELGLLQVAGRTSCEVSLVLLSLRVGKVGAFIGV